MDKDHTSSLIQTKLHRPPLPVDLVPRPRLTEWLEQRRGRPLTLVSAPAGYGKSTMISPRQGVVYDPAYLQPIAAVLRQKLEGWRD